MRYRNETRKGDFKNGKLRLKRRKEKEGKWRIIFGGEEKRERKFEKEIFYNHEKSSKTKLVNVRSKIKM